jgi:hypothetical protein
MEEFLADVKRRQGQSRPVYRNPAEYARYLASTGQENDPLQLVSARQMALSGGPLGNYTPTMAYNYFFGDMKAFYAERFAQSRARIYGDIAIQRPTASQPTTASKRPQRATAKRASAAWAAISPRKRQRRQ